MARRDFEEISAPGTDYLRSYPTGAASRNPVGWSPLAQFLTISVVLLLSYNVTHLVKGVAYLLGMGRGTNSANSEPYPTLASHTPPDLPAWQGPHTHSPKEEVPVVMYYGRPGDAPCHKGHMVSHALRQAQRHNERVHFIGPRECRQFFYTLGVAFEEYAEYEEVYEWFLRNIGSPVHVHVRWFLLKAFMERHGYARILTIAPEVLLFANATEVAEWMFPMSHMVLPVRWPSLRPPPRPHQFPSITVSSHVALLSYVALSDWCLFLLSFFRLSLFGGDLESENVPLMQAYSPDVIMGWYTFPECWQKKLDPPCLGEPDREMTPELGSKLLAHRVQPKFRVHSFCQPRACHNSSWSDEGLCTWDHDFSIKHKKGQFHFPRVDKCPSSRRYTFYQAWMGQPQKEPVQFLAVHFHGKAREVAGEMDPMVDRSFWASAKS